MLLMINLLNSEIKSIKANILTNFNLVISSTKVIYIYIYFKQKSSYAYSSNSGNFHHGLISHWTSEFPVQFLLDVIITADFFTCYILRVGDRQQP